jgi:branched-chain amino acid transport system ATP-binding protein
MGITVILIEHVMELVMKVSHKLIVLDYGEKIAEGDPETVSKDPLVIKAYLGERYAKEHAGDESLSGAHRSMSRYILEVENIKVRYSGLPVLQGVSVSVKPAETVCVVGANGSGKSTLLRAIMGSQRVFEGSIKFKGKEIQKLRTEEIVRMGIIYVPEEKMLFKPLSVEENLFWAPMF